jgi:hypothetical protein
VVKVVWWWCGWKKMGEIERMDERERMDDFVKRKNGKKKRM